MKAPRQTHRAGKCLAAAFAVRWSWRSTFPLFGPGTITPQQAVGRTAPRMRPISAVGASTPAWRRAEEASLASRMRKRSRPGVSAPGAARRCDGHVIARLAADTAGEECPRDIDHVRRALALVKQRRAAPGAETSGRLRVRILEASDAYSALHHAGVL